MSKSITCHTDGFLTFPLECVRCGKEPRHILAVEAARRWDFLVFEHDVTHEITVPLCRPCWIRRRIAGFGLGLLIVVAGLGLGMYLLSQAPQQTRTVWVGLFLVWFAAVVWYIRNRHSRWMDRLFAGVSTGRLERNGRFPLWLKRSALAGKLSYQTEPRKYIAHASYATHEERAFQQFASWQFKCLAGGLFLLAGWWTFRELARLEAGLRPQVALPAVMILVYDLAGKWAAASVVALPGVFLIAWGFWQRLSANR